MKRIKFVGRGHAGKEPVALARRLAPEMIAMTSACRGRTGSRRHAGSRGHSPGHGSPLATQPGACVAQSRRPIRRPTVSRRGRDLPIAAFPQAQNEQPDMLVGRDALARAMRSLLAERGLACVTVSAARPTWQTLLLQQPLSVGVHRGASWRGEPSASTLSRTGWHAMCHRFRPYQFGSRC